MKMFKITLILALIMVMNVTVYASTIDMDFKDADIRDVLRILAEMAELNVLTDRGVSGNVTFYLKDIEVMEAIDLVVKASGYSYEIVGKTLIVGQAADIRQRFVETKTDIIVLEHIQATTLVQTLKILYPNVEISVDQAENALVVRATEDQIKEIRAFVAQRDVKQPLRLEFIDKDVLTIFRNIAEKANMNLIASPGVKGTLTIFLRDIDIIEAIKQVAYRSNVEYTIEGNNLYISPKPEVKVTEPSVVVEDPAEPTEIEIIDIHYISQDQAVKAIEMVLPKENILITPDQPRLIIRGTKDQINNITAIMEIYDIPRIKLEGIIIREDSAMAILSIDGTSHVVREGIDVGGVHIKSITAERITVITVYGTELNIISGVIR